MRARACIVLGMLTVLGGCTADEGLDEPALDDDDGHVASTEDAVSVQGRWKLPADVAAAGATTRLTYDDAPAWGDGDCAGGMTSGAKKLAARLSRDFDAQILRVEGYACRPNTADESRMSIHGTGRALDIFIPKSGGSADNTKGDAVANWLVENSQRVGVQLVIWDRTVWMVKRADKAYGGPHPHDDHIHVEITEEAAREETPFFRGE